MSAPTAGKPTRDLLTSLARAGWGDVLGTREHHGTRAVLAGLVRRLPYKSGEGLVTVSDVADAAGYGERWTRTRLQLLEQMGIIEWRRGGVLNGTPRPSWIKVVKRALVDLIHLARPMKDAADAARRAATRARLSGIRFLRNDLTRSRRSAHTALSADPRPQGGGSTGGKPPRVDKSTINTPRTDAILNLGAGAPPTAAARAAREALRGRR